MTGEMKWMIWIGLLILLIGLVMAFVTHAAMGGFPILLWAGGALFGKAYGVWEERNRERDDERFK